jgi:flagellin
VCSSDLKGKRLQVGSEVQTPNQILITIKRMSWAAITYDSGVSAYGVNTTMLDPKATTVPMGVVMVSDLREACSYELIRATVSSIKWALKTVSTMRSDMGAVQNRLEHTIANLKNVVENTTAAESAIRDTDMAEMMVKFANNNVLAQAGQAMLAQANQANQGVLALL